jgi:CHAT domain-containing protein
VTRSGGILVSLNPAYRLREIEYALNFAGVSILIAAPQFRTAGQGLPRAAEAAGAATAAGDRALAVRSVGRAGEARAALSAALTLFEALDDPSGRADTLVDLGLVERSAGDLRSATDDLEAAVALYREIGDLGGEADALTNLGLVLQDLGADDRARELYTAALATAQARRDLERQAILLLDLGTLEHRAGNVAAARACYASSEAAWTALGRPGEAASSALNRILLDGGGHRELEGVLVRAEAAADRHLEAVVRLNLAARLRGEDPPASRRHADRALALAESLELASVHWRASYLRGMLDVDAARIPEGLQRLEQAVVELERTRQALGEDDAGRFVVGHDDVYRALIDLQLSSGHELAALVLAERLALAGLPELPLPADDPDLAHYREVLAETRFVQTTLSTELARLPDGVTDERSAALREQLIALRVDFAATIDTLRATRPDFEQLVRVDPEDLEAVQADLDPGVLVLEPVLFDDRLVLLVFTRDRLVARTIPLDGAALARTIARLVRGLRAGNVFDPDATRALCEELGATILGPLAADLDAAEVVAVSATGAFRQLPFALLRVDGTYLVERAAVVGVTHVGSLRRHDTSERRFRVDGPAMLLVGNPDGTLPGAEGEVERIAALFPGATLRLGPAGDRTSLALDAADKRLVHLATHGRIDPQRPDRSYLVLGDPGDAGHLGYGEIPGLAPYLSACRLVVLSACESGLPVDAPEPATPGEVLVSINGLAAQFRRAGVETLVASLWRVDDQATGALMDGFYTELREGTDIARALQRAQAAMLLDPRTRHPWYWAAFVVVGDWR